MSAGPEADIGGLRSVGGTILVFDRNYVAFQALLNSCIHLFGWFADVCRAFRGIFWLPMLTAKRLRKVWVTLLQLGYFGGR